MKRKRPFLLGLTTGNPRGMSADPVQTLRSNHMRVEAFIARTRLLALKVEILLRKSEFNGFI